MSPAPFLALCLVGLAACASDADRGPFAYACAEGRGFTATFDATGHAVSITASGQSRTLPQALSGSGARYAEGEAEYWSKGRGATLQGFPGGPYDGCVTDR